MKVTNKGNQVVNVVLKSGEVKLHKGESCEMPEWVYKMLVKVFPYLEATETVVEAEPAPVEVKEEPKPEVKNVKGKKSRK